MEYTAKDSYKSAKKNFTHFGSVAKHERLLAGKVVEIGAPPKELMKHLKQVEEKEDGRE